jgi:hypothetical protein
LGGAGTLLTFVLGCTLPDVSLDGMPCPCVDGYECDDATNTCRPLGGPSASSAGGQTSAGGHGGSGGGGLGGGGGACAPAAPACGDFSDDFSDPVAFEAGWTPDDPADFVVDGELTISIGSAEASSYATTNVQFMFDACAIWARIVEPAAADGLMTRISFGVGAESAYNIGIISGNLQARVGEDDVREVVTYQPAEMAYVRLRSEEGTLFYEYSADAACWTLLHAESLGGTPPTGVGRVVLDRASLTTRTSGTARFDDYGLP